MLVIAIAQAFQYTWLAKHRKEKCKIAELCGITVKVRSDLHDKVKAEQELLQQTMNQYIEMILTEHFNPKIIEKGATDMNSNNRTLAFQVSEELFQRVKNYFAKHPKLKQREFVVGLIEQELDRFEAQEVQKEQAEVAPESGDATGDGSADE